MIFLDSKFPQIDVALRRGGHITRTDVVAYETLCQHFAELRQFYLGYGCLLVQHPNDFFFLVPSEGVIRSRELSKACMHVGIFLAAKARDPEITRTAGKISAAWLMQAIKASVPRETLQQIYAPKQREASIDVRIAEEIEKALDTLARLNFIERQDDVIRVTDAIHRFGDLARHQNAPDSPARLLLETERGVAFEETREPQEEENGGDEDETRN